MKKFVMIITFVLTCSQVCEEGARFWSDSQCLKRCENQEVVCYIGGNGHGGSPSCFKK